MPQTNEIAEFNWATIEPKKRRELITSDKPGEVVLRFARQRANMKKSKREELGLISVEFWDALIDHQAWRIRASQAAESKEIARKIADMTYAQFVDIVGNADEQLADRWDKKLTKRELADALYGERVLHKSILKKKDEAKKARKKAAQREVNLTKKERTLERSRKRNEERFHELEAGLFDYSAKKRSDSKTKPKKPYSGDGVFVPKREQLVQKNKAAPIDKLQKKKKFENQEKRMKALQERSKNLNSRQRRKLKRESERIVPQSNISGVEGKEEYDPEYTLSTIPEDQIDWLCCEDEEGFYSLPVNKTNRKLLVIDAQADTEIVDDDTPSDTLGPSSVNADNEIKTAPEPRLGTGLDTHDLLSGNMFDGGLDEVKVAVLSEEDDSDDEPFLSGPIPIASGQFPKDNPERSSLKARANELMRSPPVPGMLGYSSDDEIDEDYGPIGDWDDESMVDRVFNTIDSCMNTIAGVFKHVSKKVSTHFIKMIMQLATLAFDVCVMGVSAVTAAIRFMMSYAVDGIKFAANWIKASAVPALKSFFKAIIGVVDWSKCNSIVDKVREFLQIVIHADLCKSVYKVLRVVFLSPLFGAQTVAKYFSVFGRPQKPMFGIFNIVECLVEGLSGILRAMAALSAGVPLNQILLSDNPAASFFKEANWILANSDNVYIGLPVEGLYSLNEMRTRVGDCIVAGEQLVKDMKFWDDQSTYAHSKIAALKKIQMCLEMRAKSNGRIPPYAIVVYGHAGIGKSTLRNTFFSVYANVVEREFDETQVFARDVTSEYFEGYEPLSMPYWHYPEVGNESLKMAMSKNNNIMTELQRICDTTPFPCNMAAVDLKGKYYASPEMIFIDTNNKGMWMEELMAYPAAGYRRFVYVEITPKDEFRKPNSTEIDGAAIHRMKKAAEEAKEPFDHTDVYNCNMYRYKTNDRHKVTESIYTGGFSGLLLALKKDIIRHLEKNSASRDLFGDPNRVVLDCLSKAVERESEEKCDEEKKEDGVLDLQLTTEEANTIKRKCRKVKRWAPKPIEAQSLEEEREFSELNEEEQHTYAYLWRKAKSRGEEIPHEVLLEQAKCITNIVECKRAQLSQEIPNVKNGWFTWFKNLVVSLFLWFGHSCLSKVGSTRTQFLFCQGVFILCLIATFWIPFSFLLTFPTMFFMIYIAIDLALSSGRDTVGASRRDLAEFYKGRVKSLTGISTMKYIGRKCCDYTLIIAAVAATFGVFIKRKDIVAAMSRYGANAKKYINTGIGPWKVVDPIAAQNQEVNGDPGVYNGKIVELSKEAGCIKGVIRSKDGKTNSWIDLTKSGFVAAHQSSIEDLDRMARRNTIEVNVCGLFGGKIRRHRVHLFFVKGNYALISGHVFHGMDHDEFTIRLPCGSNQLDDAIDISEIVCHRGELTPVTTDVFMLSVSYREGRDLMKHLSPGLCTTGKCMMSGVRSVAVPSGPVEHKDQGTYFHDVYVYNMATINGDCGKPLVVSVGNNGSCIAGIHVGGCEGRGYSVPITFNMVESAIMKCPTLLGIASQSGVELDLFEPKPKSPFIHESFRPVDYVGRVPGSIMLKNKSKMVRTPFAPVMDDVLSIIGGERTETFHPPVMKPMVDSSGVYISPYNVNLRKMAKPIRTLDRLKLMRIRDKLVSRIVSMLNERDVKKLSPVHLDTAINGFSDDEFFRRINMSASAGFGYPGKKLDYFTDVSVDDHKQYVLGEDSVENLAKVIETYANGERCHFVYKAQLKDEPRPAAKVISGSTRLFYMSSLENLIVSRMFLGPFYTLMVQHGDIFRTSVGVNIHDEADDLVRDMLRVGTNFIEFDYSGFDVSNVFDIAHCASGVVYGVLEGLGYNDFALSVVRGLLSDTLYPLVELNKDLFTKPGMQMSGRYATAEDNSLRNLVMLMYAWESLYPDDDFFVHTRINTFGDDVVGSVDDNHLKYNNLFYQDFALREYGMVVTPAVKNNEMCEFLSVDEISYLKRNFRLREGVYVAPIDVNTIYKMMEWRIPSTSVTEEEQLIAMATSCLWEVFFHADEGSYNKVRDIFVSVLVNHTALPKRHFYDRLPLYCILHQEKIEKHPSFDGDVSRRVPIDAQSDSSEEKDGCSPCVPSDKIQTRYSPARSVQSDRRVFQRTPKTNEVNDMIDSLESELKEIEVELRALSSGDENLYRYVFSPGMRDEATDRTGLIYVLLARKESIRATIVFLRKRVVINAQSDTIEMEMSPPGEELKEFHDTFVDVGGDETCKRPVGLSEKVLTSQVTRHKMEGILSRPVEIVSTSIPLNANVRVTFSVWDLFSLNPTVRAKLRNFAYLRGDLHLRVTISGSPFHYGRLLFSYQPMPLRNENLAAHALQYLTFGESSIGNYLSYLSQAPGCVIADVKANKPFEMKLPYISHKAMFRLFNDQTTVIADTDSYDDLKDFGKLYVYTLNQIGSVSESPSNVHMQIVAWMEDVDLGTPTASVVIVAESDERETGPVERISTAMARSVGALSEVPVIGPYAQASSIAFSVAAEIAAFFGWSRPLLPDEPAYVRPKPVGNMANGIGYDTSEKLTMDPKQEIILNPRCCGTTSDDMVFKNIYGRWSYLTTFDWSPTDNTLSSVLWRCAINPALCTYFNGISKTYFQPSAMAFCAAPFRYWNGAIEIRIEIVCSNFHRGKLAVLYEPNVHHQVLVCNSITTNKNHMKILDLQEVQVMDFCVNWAHKRMWAQTYAPSESHSLYGDVFDVDGERQNGFVAVTPYTTLQSPDNSSVKVNVYVRGKELSFSYYDGSQLPRERIVAQSEELQCEAVACMDLNEPTYGLEDSSMWHFGESYGSFRVPLKRFSVVDLRDVQNSSTASTRTIVYNGETNPKARPPYGTTMSRAVHLLEYLMYGYLGLKGSCRYKAHFASDTELFNRSHRLHAYLASPTDVYGGTDLNYSNERLSCPSTGSIGFVPAVSGGYEIEVPFFTTNMFIYAFADDHVGDNPSGDMSTNWVRRFTFAGEISAPPTYLHGTMELAIGEDFSLIRFSGAPAYSGGLVS